MVLPFKYSLRSLWVRRRTTLATAVGIALVVFVLASSLMLAAGVRQTLVSAGSNDKALVMSHAAYIEDGSQLQQSAIALVAAAPGVRRTAEGRALVSGETSVQLPFDDLDDPTRIANVQVRGVTDSAFRLRPEVRIIQGRRAKSATNEVIIGKGLLNRYRGLAFGSGFEIKKGARLSIVGVFEAAGSAYESEVWTDVDALRSSLGWEGHLSSVTAQLESASAFDAFELTLESDKRLGLSVERQSAYYERVSRNLSTSIIGLGSIVTVIFSLGAMLGAMLTMYAAVGQRSKEIGTLRALGFTPTQVLVLFVLESTALAVVGAASGVLFALVTPFLDFSTTNMATGQALAFRFLPDPRILIGAALAGTLVGTIGGFFPALKAARTTPSIAMRA